MTTAEQLIAEADTIINEYFDAIRPAIAKFQQRIKPFNQAVSSAPMDNASKLAVIAHMERKLSKFNAEHGL